MLLFFVLFAFAALSFALALSPFFKNARVGAFAGPLLFFLSSQFYNLFLDQARRALHPISVQSPSNLRRPPSHLHPI